MTIDGQREAELQAWREHLAVCEACRETTTNHGAFCDDGRRFAMAPAMKSAGRGDASVLTHVIRRKDT